ncbi:MAG: endonuclease/exonuclease/phosphatase family protein, partial [Leptospira sp.]|nr:endonuclease/exonuclease/phosphatase family protein [Leptospira sp.]
SAYFMRLSPDIALLQEIENETAIYKIADKKQYSCRGSENPVSTQQVFICWKKELGNPDIKVWNELLISERLRPAISAEFKINDRTVNVFNIHLKSGNPEYDYGRDFVIRKKQFIALNRIIKGKSSFIIGGDFNQRFDKPDDRGWKILQRSINLLRVNEGLQPDCWGYRTYYIDHFVYSGDLNLSEFKQYKYNEDDGKFDGDPETEKGLSDHCPMTAVLKL